MKDWWKARHVGMKKGKAPGQTGKASSAAWSQEASGLTASRRLEAKDFGLSDKR